LRQTTWRLWRWIVAVIAGVLCSGLALHLTGASMPLATLADLVRTAPTPAETALRKALSELGGRANGANAEDLAAATQFYNARSGRLLWVSESGLSERGNAVVAEVRRADDWGLRSRDFALPQASGAVASPEAAAATELALTFAVLQYARYASGGRFDLRSLSKAVDYKPPVRRAGDVLAEIAASRAPDAYLRSLHPRHAQFQALRRLLVKLRGSEAASGVGPRRESADRSVLMARIIVNMERWRWLPADLGDFHVWSNVPEFLARVVSRGKIVHTDRIVAGQPEWPTPAFSADMKTIVFHPSWGVPDGIRRKELLPRLREASQGGLMSLFTGAQSSRDVLERLKLQVTYRGRPIDPDTVDWRTANIGAYEFRQPPGPANPLGRLKFNFPNRHDVYMHDTTASEHDLFARPYRGFSHGCMRVSDPFRLAVIVLARDKGWSEQEVQDLVNGRATREVALSSRIPVHMTYFTAMVDAQGNLQTFGDLYGLDTRMGAVLFGTSVPFVTPRYDGEMRAMRERYRRAPSGGPNLADAIAAIFSP
jgi:murein L,D-transpeptidase YcbB/YkuD